MDKIKSDEFEEKLSSAKYVIIDLSSPGCAPCRKVPPLINDILTELQRDNISAFEVNVAEEPAIAQKLFVLGVPTIIVFKDTKEIARFNSLPKKEKLKKALE